MSNKADIIAAFRLLVETTASDPQGLGELLYERDESGHSALCRFLSTIRHYGPRGTFVELDRIELHTGGYLCSFGVECGKASSSYLERVHEQAEQFWRLGRILRKSGALVTHAWENPRFSSKYLCTCGRPRVRNLDEHEPLCNYRVEHDHPVSIDEYRAAVEKLQ